MKGADAVTGLLASRAMAGSSHDADRPTVGIAADTSGPPRWSWVLAVVFVGVVGLILASDLPEPVRRVTSGAALVISGAA